MVITSRESPTMKGFYNTFVFVMPMQGHMDAINAFYDEKRNDLSLTLGLSVFLSVIAVIIVTFFVLNYLIRKRITEPIDLLASEAKEVMECNLDVDIKVHEGGEFQGLERAFKEMVTSIQRFIERSIREE